MSVSIELQKKWDDAIAMAEAFPDNAVILAESKRLRREILAAATAEASAAETVTESAALPVVAAEPVVTVAAVVAPVAAPVVAEPVATVTPKRKVKNSVAVVTPVS